MAKSLEDLRYAAWSLSATAECHLHPDAKVQLNDLRPIFLGDFSGELRAAAAAADAAAADAGGPGRPADLFSGELAEVIGFAFHDLTGKRPTLSNRLDDDGKARAYGEYLDLVATVFRAAGLKAKPERHARAAAKALKARLQRRPDGGPRG